MSTIHEDVQNYYGHELQQSSDLKTDACCSKTQVPSFIKDILKNIHPEVMNRYYGCGLVFPPKLEGCRVLDLGSGAGRDVYILSSLVGPTGYVVGVDMTKEQVSFFHDYRVSTFSCECSSMWRIVTLIIIPNNLVLKKRMLNFVVVKLNNSLMMLN